MAGNYDLVERQSDIKKYSDFERLLEQPVSWNSCRVVNPITGKEVVLSRQPDMSNELQMVVRQQKALMPHKRVVYNVKIIDDALVIKLIPITGAA